MAANMYRVGDYVYFEISSGAPYQIRRIEELNKTPNGNVESKVMCFYRRRDISPTLLDLADRHQSRQQEDVHTVNGNGNSVTVNGVVNGSDSKNIDDDEKPNTKEEKSTLENGSVASEQVTVSSGSNKFLVPVSSNCTGGPTVGLLGMERLSDLEKHCLKHRELFLSRQIETLPATHIRGKCSVTLLNETETPDNYLGKDDLFFYSLVYDPQQKTLLADKGEIRQGDKYQATVTELLSEEEKKNDRTQPLETIVFQPFHQLTDRQIDQFLIIARAVGTFSRALDSTSSVKQPSLHMSAAAASRDITLFHAMALLHHANYDLGKAICFLVPPPSKQLYPLDADKTTGHNTASLGGPVLCRDQMEEWSAAEANLFEEALEKYGKDFGDIRNDFLPWKSLRDIVEYYYMWKTTDRYVQQKRVKAAEAESRLKQVYIPNYNKPNPAAIAPNNPVGQIIQSNKPCEGCSVHASSQWYLWGPQHQQLRLCHDCWIYWKKCGALKKPHILENYDKVVPKAEDVLNSTPEALRQKQLQIQQMVLPPTLRCTIPGCHKEFRIKALFHRHFVEDHGVPPPANLDQACIVGGRNVSKPRAAFFLHTTLLTRIARRLSPKQLLNSRQAARKPFNPINMLAIKQNCQSKPLEDVRVAAKALARRFPSVNKLMDKKLANASGRSTIASNANINMATRMGLTTNASSVRVQVSKTHSPVPVSASVNNAVKPPSTQVSSVVNNCGVVLTGAANRKRPLQNGVYMDGPSAKRPAVAIKDVFQNHVGIPTAKRHYLAWMETAEDCYFQHNSNTKLLRRRITSTQFKRLARRPCKNHAFAAAHLPPMPKTTANCRNARAGPIPVQERVAQ